MRCASFTCSVQPSDNACWDCSDIVCPKLQPGASQPRERPCSRRRRAETWAVIEAQVKNTLEQAGYKNIQVMPSSFVVQAERNGKPLTLVINSDGKTVSYLPVSPNNPNEEERKDVDKTLGKE